MMLPKDLLSENYRKPQVILCQTNKEKICPLDATDLQATLKFNGYSEISFNVASVYHDLISGENKRTPYYDYVEGLRLVYLEGFGYFQLQDPELYGDGIQEYKQINGYSLEYSLSQRYLETFIINMGDVGDTIGSIDGVVLYNPSDVEHSLLHLVLQKAYGWTIGHVDAELQSQSRSFEVDRESIYDFLMNDLCDTFKCYIEFDTIKNTVNVYSENEIERFVGDGEQSTFQLTIDLSDTTSVTINGHIITQYTYNKDTKEITFSVAPAQGDIIEITDEYKKKYDTDVIIAFENLSNEMRVNYSSDDIKTVLTVKGADDLDIRDVNFGLPSIMNLDYYCTPEWMGDKLYNEYLLYSDKQDKYMSGFYSKDFNSATEELFNVSTNTETFVAGNIQEFTAKEIVNIFNADGEIQSFDINKVTARFDVNSVTENHMITGSIETFTEPEMRTETVQCSDPTEETIAVQETTAEFTAEDSQSEFQLLDDFNFNINSIVKVNGIKTVDYHYNDTDNTIVFNASLSKDDIVQVISCENKFNITSTISALSKVTLNDNELGTSEYNVVNSVLTINAELNVDDTIQIFTYKNVFRLPSALTSNSVIYINDEVCRDYSYDNRNNRITINRRLTSEDVIKICTADKIITNFVLTNAGNKISSVKVDGKEIMEYSVQYSDGSNIVTITNSALLTYGSKIEIESIDNSFLMKNVNDKIIAVKINDVTTGDYQVDDNQITITDKNLRKSDMVTIESINMHFDLSQHKDKEIVAVSINGGIISTDNYSFNKETGILTIIKYNLKNKDYILVNLVANQFTVPKTKDKLLSVKIDTFKIESTQYQFNNATGVLTIADIDTLFNGGQLTVAFVDEYFVLNVPYGRIIAISIDGQKIQDNEFRYTNNKLYIMSSLLEANSYINVILVDTHFKPTQLEGKIEKVSIDDVVTSNYEYDANQNLLLINDEHLEINSIVRLETVNNQFYLSEIKNAPLVSVTVDGIKISNYALVSDVLFVYDTLSANSIIVVEFIDNHFTTENDIGDRHIIEKKSNDDMQFETLSEGNNGYTYDSATKILTIHVPLQNGDQIKVRTIDTTNALLVVESNPNDGEIALNEVIPTLKSYTPKVGDYVVKINGYTEILKELYELIDKRLTEENSVPDEYKITEIKLNPDNFDQADLFLPEPSIENLGEVYKIINQDKVEEDGQITYNDIACKYYVCEIKMMTITDDSGQTKNQYTYLWNERNIVFGGDGINSLKEKIDIYSSINDVQVAAEWDQKPQDSDEYKSYIDNLNKLQQAKDELEKKQKGVEDINEQIQLAREQIQSISKDVSIDKNFSPDSLDRLSLFLREDEYTDDCFCVTDIDTDLDIINTKKELLAAGFKKLKTISRPTLSFSASIKNLYAMPEFTPILRQFNLGNFVKVKIRDDYIKKARLLEVQLNFDDLSSLSCTFGDLLSAKDQGDLHADLLAQAVSAGKAVASGSSYWQKGYDVATAIEDKIRQGLIDATTSIKSNSAGQNVSWDNYGIHLRKIVDGILDNHEGWITNNKFLYSDDNFKTTKSVFGNYTIDGETYWGILAGCVSAGLIEGSKIIGGEICIGEREDGTYNFRVAPDGTVTMNKGDAAAKLSYFSFDGDNGLIIGENKDGDYFSRVSAQRIEFCRKARILTVTSEPTHIYSNYDYILYEHQENNITYYDYYKNPDFIYKTEEPIYEARYTNENPIDIEAEIKFGVPITYFANDTTYMKQAEIEGDLKVGTTESTPSITLGSFKLQIESNGSLSIVAT